MLRRSRAWWLATGAVLIVLAAPYLVAARLQPADSVFSGFLLNPVDGFSYLAKMREGADGSWLFRLPYAAEPGEGAAIFLTYLALGHLQRWSGLSPMVVYHLARLGGAALMYGAAWVFFGTVLPSARARGWAFALMLAGSGLGWAGVAMGRLPVDLWVPEAIPFLAAFTNPHFPLALAALLVGFTSIVTLSDRTVLRSVAGAAAGMVIGIVQPFALAIVTIVGGLWLAWERLSPGSGERPARTSIWPLISFLIASVPWAAYAVWVSRTNPALASWSAQNQTPTPPLLDVAMGLGVPLALAVAGAWSLRTGRLDRRSRLLIAWLVAGVLLPFAPIALQRRLLIGIFFPMAALAGIALERWIRTPGRRAATIAAFALCLPTNPLLVAMATSAALSQDPGLVFSAEERASYDWASQNLRPDSLVLAEETTGNRLPAFAPVRVVYGHPFETPDADTERAWVDQTLGGVPAGEAGLARLLARGVDYVYIGPREKALGSPSWLTLLDPVYRSPEIQIYAVPPP